MGVYVELIAYWLRSMRHINRGTFLSPYMHICTHPIILKHLLFFMSLHYFWLVVFLFKLLTVINFFVFSKSISTCLSCFFKIAPIGTMSALMGHIELDRACFFRGGY